MRKSLFALENADETGVDATADVAVDEGEASSALVETTDEATEITGMADDVSEGGEAAGQMEEVQDLVEDVAENGEGLDPVAAEAIRISVEAICARVGANPRAVYSLYATENFQSPSSRKANTRITLEGIGDFLKDLYARIKAALLNMWTKIKAFWAKHISTLGRVKKALEAMKTKVASSSGTFKDRADMDEAPNGMVAVFPSQKPINAALIGEFIKVHAAVTSTVEAVNVAIGNNNTKATGVNPDNAVQSAGALEVATKRDLNGRELGTESAPMVGGLYIKYTVEAEEGVATITVDRETVDKGDAKAGLIMGDKSALKTVLDNTLTVINSTIKIKDKADKLEESVKKLMDAMGKAVNAKVDGGKPEEIKGLRDVLKIANQVNAKMASVNVEIITQNIRLAKGVLGYSALSLKNFKPKA